MPHTAATQPVADPTHPAWYVVIGSGVITVARKAVHNPQIAQSRRCGILRRGLLQRGNGLVDLPPRQKIAVSSILYALVHAAPRMARGVSGQSPRTRYPSTR